MTLIRMLAWAYLGACVVALGLFVLGLPALAGANADPLAGVFAFVLALPWILVLDLLAEPSMAASLVVTVGAMALNFSVLRWAAHRRNVPPSAENAP